MTTIRDATTADPVVDDAFGVVVRVRTNGTVDVDLGGGQVVESVPVMESSWAPASGATVALLRHPSGRRVVLGPTRTANAATVSQASVLRFPFNVTASTTSVANPLVVAAVSSGSWRSSDGWAGGYMPTTDAVAQGSYSSSSPYYRGCWFYGSVWAGLAGRRCTSLTIRVPRLGAGGASAATQQVIGPHVHSTRPSGEPLFPWGAVNVGSLAWGQVGELALPTSWGDLLISGQAAGFGHLLMAYGSGNQSYAAGVGADPLSGRVTLGWA